MKNSAVYGDDGRARRAIGDASFEYVDVRAIGDGKRYWNGTRWMG